MRAFSLNFFDHSSTRASAFGLSWLLFCSILSLTSCSTVDAKTASRYDYNGIRFCCGKIYPMSLCLNFLEAQCKLVVMEGDSIPPEITQEAFIEKGGKRTRVTGPDTLRGCVKIGTPAEALEYARFFTSYWTNHLFQRRELEIFPRLDKRCHSVCLPTEHWHALGLADAEVAEKNGVFVIRRTVMRKDRSSLPFGIAIYKIFEIVTTDGDLAVVSEERLPASDTQLGFLGFPVFM